MEEGGTTFRGAPSGSQGEGREGQEGAGRAARASRTSVRPFRAPEDAGAAVERGDAAPFGHGGPPYDDARMVVEVRAEQAGE